MPISAVGTTAQDVDAWSYFVLGGINSPGSIPRGGVKGFKRETGWDIKKGKGVAGATLTLTSQPPVQGSITLHLIGPGGFDNVGNAVSDFSDWDAFVFNVLSIATTTQQAQGLSFYYPGTASIGLTTVVVRHYTGPEHLGKGLYQATIDFIEWSPPPSVNNTSTVTSEKNDQSPGGGPPKPTDPRVAQAQAANAAARAAAASGGG